MNHSHKSGIIIAAEYAFYEGLAVFILSLSFFHNSYDQEYGFEARFYS